MKLFTLAFPVATRAEEFLAAVGIAAPSKAVLLPGYSIAPEVLVQAAVPGLAEIFAEHEPLTEAERASLDAHVALVFLRGGVAKPSDLLEWNKLAKLFFAAGALGVYAEHSGAAFSKAAFESFDLEALPLEPWLNYVETVKELYTLGMEALGFPDFCVSLGAGDRASLMDLLLSAASELFMGGGVPKSGEKLETDLGTFELRAEPNLPFPKTAPEWNRLRALRLVRRAG